eukprot:Skav205133  [mRNA]  locus=scaffold3411:100325:109647:- [translate_table: standard]
MAALHGNVSDATAALASGEQVNSRFVYETYFQGNAQEGSGEAIHLAASRGNVEVVKLLLEKKASLTATVSRSHKPHYDVLHAAMFAEGRGGTLAMISYLFEARAELTRNQDGRWPIHVAFLTGNVPAINLLRTFMKRQNITDGDYKVAETVRGGKMSEQELSDAAEAAIGTDTWATCGTPWCSRGSGEAPYLLGKAGKTIICRKMKGLSLRISTEHTFGLSPMLSHSRPQGPPPASTEFIKKPESISQEVYVIKVPRAQSLPNPGWRWHDGQIPSDPLVGRSIESTPKPQLRRSRISPCRFSSMKVPWFPSMGGRGAGSLELFNLLALKPLNKLSHGDICHDASIVQWHQ